MATKITLIKMAIRWERIIIPLAATTKMKTTMKQIT